MNKASLSVREPGRINYVRLGAVFLIALMISCSWLAFPYFLQGKQMLRDVGDSSRVIKGGSVSRYYSRQLIHHPMLELSATFATPEYFQFVDNANVVGNLRPDKFFVFFVSENIHSGQLASALPQAMLSIDGKQYRPVNADGPAMPEHHRVTAYSFSKRDADGNEIRLDEATLVQLSISDYWHDSPQKLTFSATWEAPFDLPDDLKASTGITPIAVLALGAGLLSSVLTPCLLQLVVVFASIIGGFASVPVQPGSRKASGAAEITPVIRRKIMHIALAFVAGFTLLYMLAGVLIGAVGHQAQLMFAEYSRMVAIISGSLVILLGLWVGLRGMPHFACKIPSSEFVQSLSVRDNIGSILLSMGYALGCTACFGGAIVATLIVYVGVIGSPTIGAGIMLIFSIGVAIPFLLAAYYISRMDSMLILLAEKASLLSKISMLLIISFGLILVTDNFHSFSDLIYPYLGLY